MLKKYLFLSFLLFSNLYSMESFDQECTEELVLINHDFSKETLNLHDKKILLDLLPREIWIEILSFLNYKENRKAFIKFWGPNLGSNDLNSKKMAIDIHRSAILNSKNLFEWEKTINNVCNSWKHKESKDTVKKYLYILNKEFNDDIKKHKWNIFFDEYWKQKFDSLRDKCFFLKSFSLEKVIIKKDYVTILNFVQELLNLKKIVLIINDFEKPVRLKNKFCTVRNNLFVFTLIFISGIVVCIYNKSFYLAFLTVSLSCVIILFAQLIIEKIFHAEEQAKMPSIQDFNYEIRRNIKLNKIDIFESDKYFLEILGHKFEQDHEIKDLNLDNVSLDYNGKEEISSEEDLSIV